MRYRLTDATVKKLAAPERGNKIYYDKITDGFGLRVTKNGARAFVLNYFTRADRREKRYTIGPIDTWPAVVARNEAKRLLREIDAGNDPLAKIEEERSAPTVADLVERYVAEHLPKKRPRSQLEDRRKFPLILPELGKLKVAAVTFSEVDALHRKLTRESGPIHANRTIALVSKMMALAIKWHWRADNPCRGLEKNPEHQHTRYLSAEELRRLMAALELEEDQQAADIIRLLLLTGARSGEALAAEWSQFDLAAGVWVKPHSLTKQKQAHRLPLSAEAIELLTRLYEKRGTSRWVFPSANPFKHRPSIRHAWDRLRVAAGLGDMRIHDLRHSHASLLVNAGYSLPVIGAVLGHRVPQTTQRYAHLNDESLRAAARSVGALVLPFTKGKAS
jgi:integrase